MFKATSFIAQAGHVTFEFNAAFLFSSYKKLFSSPFCLLINFLRCFSLLSFRILRFPSSPARIRRDSDWGNGRVSQVSFEFTNYYWKFLCRISMTFASPSSVICQNRALTFSVVSSPGVLHHRCFSCLQPQRFLHCNRRSSSNIGINVTPAASSVVAKTALSDAHVQSQSSSSAPGTGKCCWNNFLLLFYFVFIISSYWNDLQCQFDWIFSAWFLINWIHPCFVVFFFMVLNLWHKIWLECWIFGEQTIYFVYPFVLRVVWFCQKRLWRMGWIWCGFFFWRNANWTSRIRCPRCL